MLGSPPTIASLNGLVAAAHPLAAQAGARILGAGGNAFDAAVAVAAALNVVEPAMSGLAGMGLATCYVAAERRVRVLNFIPRVGETFDPDAVADRDDLVRGGLGAGSPGCLAGWCELHRAYGRLPLAAVLAPAIGLAETGFPLIELNVHCIAETHTQLAGHDALLPAWRAAYMPEGRLPRLGDVLRQPELARTLQAIADEGPAYLYDGPLGAAMVARVRELGGTMTAGDLRAVAPQWQEPAVGTYRGHAVHVPPPPCQGFQYLLTLAMLDGVDLAGMERNGAGHLDMVVRAIRIAAGERIRLGNPPAAELAGLMDAANIERLRARLLAPEPVHGETEAGEAEIRAPEHTTSFSVGDAEGNLVCITQSLGQFFGSGIVVPGFGVCLNDMPAFGDLRRDSRARLVPGAPFVQPMSPSIVMRNGEAVLALGTPGSFGIMQTQAQALVQIVDFGQTPQQAIASPRVRLWDGDEVEVEARIAAPVIEELRRRGHRIRMAADWTTKVGGMHAVARDPDTGVLTGGADPRRDGIVAAL